MIILTQASDGGTGIFLALFIAIGQVALAAWVTHWIWFFRSFGKDNVVLNIMRKNWLRYFLGVMDPHRRDNPRGRNLDRRRRTGRRLADVISVSMTSPAGISSPVASQCRAS